MYKPSVGDLGVGEVQILELGQVLKMYQVCIRCLSPAKTNVHGRCRASQFLNLGNGLLLSAQKISLILFNCALYFGSLLLPQNVILLWFHT